MEFYQAESHATAMTF